MLRPLLFGYQTVRLTTTPAEAEAGRRTLAQFAVREGFALAEIFVERDPNHPCSALVALIELVRRHPGSIIAAPTADDFGRLPRVRQIMRTRLERESGARVLIIHAQTPRRRSRDTTNTDR
jgi:hypothetical protein